MDLTRKRNFLGGQPWFKFNNLGPVLGRALIFCSRVRRIETMQRKNKLVGEGSFSAHPFPECAWSCFSNWVFDVPELLCSWTYYQCALNSLIIIFYNGAAASNLIMWAIYIYKHIYGNISSDFKIIFISLKTRMFKFFIESIPSLYCWHN